MVRCIQISATVFISLMVLVWGQPLSLMAQDAPAPEVYSKEEIQAAAEAFLGAKYTAGLEAAFSRVFKDLGVPEAYFTGTEDGGITEIGYRYGEGTLYQKGAGTRRVYWSQPSIGFENVAPGTQVFTLVFNFHDYKSFYKRFESGESDYFFHAGVAMSYRKRLDMSLAQIRAGVEVNEGLNPAWIKFGESAMVVPNVVRD